MNRAADVVARRDVARIEREKSVQARLADFFQAQEAVERIEADATKAAEPYEAAMRDAVLALDGLEETRTGIAELTGLSPARVREYLAVLSTSAARTAGKQQGQSDSSRAAVVDDSPSATAPASA